MNRPLLTLAACCMLSALPACEGCGAASVSVDGGALRDAGGGTGGGAGGGGKD